MEASCVEELNVAEYETKKEVANEEIIRLWEDYPDKYLALLLLSGLFPSWKTLSRTESNSPKASI